MPKSSYIPIEKMSKLIISSVYKQGLARGVMSSSATPDRMGGNDLGIEYTFFNKTSKIQMNYGKKDHEDFERDLRNITRKGRNLLSSKLERGLDVVFSETGTGKANILVSGRDRAFAKPSPEDSVRTPVGRESGRESIKKLREKWYKKD